MLFFFFFKQKTAYDMRISDWSSDVCSSDLNHFLDCYELFAGGAVTRALDFRGFDLLPIAKSDDFHLTFRKQGIQPGPSCLIVALANVIANLFSDHVAIGTVRSDRARRTPPGPADAVQAWQYATLVRSEEHTSELQSLMRISYAVFCLKKTSKKTHNQNNKHLKTQK